MKRALLVLSGLVSFTLTSSQNLPGDSTADRQLQNAVAIYDRYTDRTAPIYNGREYLYYTTKMDGDPFFLISDISNGWVSYEGTTYALRSVLYDVTRNEVLIGMPDSISRIVLQNEFIDSFEASGHIFIHLAPDPEQNLAAGGFYDEMYNGNVRLLATRRKTVEKVIRDNAVILQFSTKDRFYIFKKGLYYLVDNQRDVLRLFADEKHDLKKLLRSQHLKFRHKNFENILVKVTAFYDQLIH